MRKRVKYFEYYASSSSAPAWTPLSINPGAYFDWRLVEEFDDNSYGTALNFHEISVIKNQASGNNGTVTGASKPIIARQGVFGYNAMNCQAGNFEVTNYAAIDFQYNEAFYVAFSFLGFLNDDRNFLNKRANGSGQGGWWLNLTNKISFGFSDVTNGDLIEVEMDTVVNDGLPHTLVIQNSDGTAAGISFYLDGVLQSKTILQNDAGLTDIKGGSLKIGTGYASSHDAPPIYLSTLVIGSGTFSAFSNYSTFVTRVNRWEVLKYSTNPVIAGTTQSAVQAYPSTIIYWEPTAKYYCYVGSTSTKIVCMSSDDAYTWVEEGVVITSSTGWNESYSTQPTAFIEGGTIYIFLLGNSGSGSDLNYKTGYYSSTSPTSGFTQNATPVFEADDYNAVFNNNMTGAYLTDCVKHSSLYYWSGVALDLCRSEIFIATSTDFPPTTITPVQKVATYTQPSFKRSLLQAPKVFETDWGWIMTYTVGMQGATVCERNIRSAYSTSATPTDFTIVNEDFLNSNILEWDALRVYVNGFYKEFDDDSFKSLIQIGGNYIGHYSGHDLGSNAGQTGIAEFSVKPDLRSGRECAEPAFVSTTLDALPNCLTRIFSDEHVYHTADTRVYQVVSSVNYSEATPIGADDERPYRIENELNGLPVIRFDGSNKLRYGRALGNPSSWTQSFVVKSTNLSADNILFGALNTGGGQLQSLVQIRSTGSIRSLISNDAADAFTTTVSDNGVITANTWNIIQVTYQNGEDFMRIYLNGVELVTTKASTSLTSTGTVVRTFALGAASFYGPDKLIGDMAYFAMYSSALSVPNLTIESNFLTTKYNL